MFGKRYQHAIILSMTPSSLKLNSKSSVWACSPYHDMMKTNYSYPGSVHFINASTYKGTLRAEEESYHIGTLF